MLTAGQAALLNNTIATQLDAVGKGIMPQSNNNRESEAWDYFIGTKIEKFGKAMRDKARKKAIKVGVLFDHEKAPMPPGTDEVVFAGDVITINCTVKAGAESVDGRAFYNAVLAARIIDAADLPVFKQLFDNATKVNRGAHTFAAELTV